MEPRNLQENESRRNDIGKNIEKGIKMVWTYVPNGRRTIAKSVQLDSSGVKCMQ